MSFSPTNIQIRILKALNQLQLQKCKCWPTTERDTTLNVWFGTHVPSYVLIPWVELEKEDFDLAMDGLIRRGLVEPATSKLWPFGGTSLRLHCGDGRMICLLWGDGTFGDYLEQLSKWNLPGTVTKDPAPATAKDAVPLGFWIFAWVGRLKGTVLKNAKMFPSWTANHEFPQYSITKEGLVLLDSLPPQTQADQAITLGFASETRKRRSVDDLQMPLLKALKHLEYTGTPIHRPKGGINTQFRFRTGVPRILLREWLGILDDDLKNIIDYCERQQLVDVRGENLIRSVTLVEDGKLPPSGETAFSRDDGAVIRLVWEPGPDNGLIVVAQACTIEGNGDLKGDGFLTSIRTDQIEPMVKITGKGIERLNNPNSDKSGFGSGDSITDPNVASGFTDREFSGPADAARFYARITGTVANTANATRRLKSADGKYWVSFVAEVAARTIAKRPKDHPSRKTVHVAEDVQRCPDCDRRIPKGEPMWGGRRICRLCMVKLSGG